MQAHRIQSQGDVVVQEHSDQYTGASQLSIDKAEFATYFGIMGAVENQDVEMASQSAGSDEETKEAPMESIILDNEVRTNTRRCDVYVTKSGRKRIKNKYSDEQVAAFIQRQENLQSILDTPTPGETVLGPSAYYLAQFNEGWMREQPQPLGNYIVPKEDYPDFDIQEAIDKKDLFVFFKK